MKLCRLIAPDWLKERGVIAAITAELSPQKIAEYNKEGYGIYYFPNSPKDYETGATVDSSDINNFEYVFVDCDFKAGVFKNEEEFLETIGKSGIEPFKIVNSGNGVHVYWKITDLDAMSYVRFQRRLARLFNTDLATGKICQLMRLECTLNTKEENNFKPCELLFTDTVSYTCEEFDKLLPRITKQDEQYCQTHFEKTYEKKKPKKLELPAKFGALVDSDTEVRHLFEEENEDRSKADWRLGHIMFANGFSMDEAMAVLSNTRKALERAPVYQESYAKNICEKIWTFELAPQESKLSKSVEELLRGKSSESLKGERFKCHPCIDNTQHGFRRGQVIGLVAGTGIGKTAFALNMFKWFCVSNPECHHFFVPLEQPADEIADRWRSMCGDDTSTFNRVHIISNYADDGTYRNLSFEEIKQYILKFKADTNYEVGCVVIDHIGVLRKKMGKGENQDITDICHAMKGFAVSTKTMLVMQSQTSRDKSGAGDLELDRDAAYGTMYFEAYCDYLITLWQPVKRCYGLPNCPAITAFKFCKIRHKKVDMDVIKEGTLYYLAFEPSSETLRAMTQKERESFEFYLPQAVSMRKMDKKTDMGTYLAPPTEYGVANAKT